MALVSKAFELVGPACKVILPKSLFSTSLTSSDLELSQLAAGGAYIVLSSLSQPRVRAALGKPWSQAAIHNTITPNLNLFSHRSRNSEVKRSAVAELHCCSMLGDPHVRPE